MAKEQVNAEDNPFVIDAKMDGKLDNFEQENDGDVGGE